MKPRRPLHVAATILFAALAIPDAAHPAPLDASARKCVEAINKAAAKLTTTRMKTAASCIAAGQRGKIEKLGIPPQTQTAQACLDNDVKGTVAKAEDKLAEADVARCLVLPVLPELGYGSASAAMDAASDAAKAVAADLFGPDLDAALASDLNGDPARDKDGAKCQRAVASATHRLAAELLKGMRKAKKSVLRGQDRLTGTPGAPVASAAELAAELVAHLPVNGHDKLDDREAKLADAAISKCEEPSPAVALEVLFPGVCALAAQSGAQPLAECAAARARCRFCEALELFDTLEVDCDSFDDEAANSSCVPVLAGDVIYVAVTGNDADPGTPAQPKATLQAGIDAAVVSGFDEVRVAAGLYGGPTLALADGVSVRGGFDAVTWAPDSGTTTFNSTQAVAVTAVSITTMTEIEKIAFVAASAAVPGASSYAATITGSNGLVLRDVELQAGSGAAGVGGSDGAAGASGANGQTGAPGCENSGFLCETCSQPMGGPGGFSACGRTGGVGGLPGLGGGIGMTGGTGNVGTPGGPGAPCGGSPTCDGQTGTNGTNGPAGGGGSGGASMGSFLGAAYLPANGASGNAGEHGNGGGGGGGGGGGDDDCDSYGSSGGGGGGGGCGGSAGSGGSGGGGSFAAIVLDSDLTIENSTLVAGGGGAGGAGGSGGAGGDGGSGGAGGPYGGSSEQDDGGDGAAGGSGGDGGNGGAGGGGGGGPSIGIVCLGTTNLTVSGSTITPGAGGAGGASTSPGSNGISTAMHGCS